MQILTININERLATELSAQLNDSVSHAQCMNDACSEIENHDFQFIIKNTDSQSSENDDINALLGLTPISTKILLIGNTIDSPNQAHWRELGIEYLLSPTGSDLIQKINTNGP